MSQKFTKAVAKLVNAIDRNTRGVAKVVSAMAYIMEGGAPDFGTPEKLDKALRGLLAERRVLRDGLEAELKKQEGWKR